MTPKQTALLRVATLAVAGILTSIGATIIFTLFTVDQIGVGFCALLLIFAGKMVYDIELAKAEAREKLNEKS